MQVDHHWEIKKLIIMDLIWKIKELIMDMAGEIRVKMKVILHVEIKVIKMDSIGIKNNN